MDRRDFLKQSGLAAGIGLSSPARASSRPIALAVDPMDKVAASAPAIWALGELRRDLASAGYTVRDIRRAQEAKPGELCLAVAGDSSQAPDAFNIGPAAGRGLGFVEVGGGGERGLVYALTALAERARLGRDLSVPERDSPVNQVRSVARFFVSDVEDKPWFNDRDFWRAYLTNLAVHRFNRFNFTLGIGYDFARQIRDCYFHFPYPFLMDVKGYHVRAKGLPDDERDSNFAMLKFMAKETVARGLQFHLGLWTHAYQWTDSPHANYIIEGLTPETQAS